MTDQDPGSLKTASIRYAAFRGGIIVVPVSRELAARDEILIPWEDTDEGKELAKIETDFGIGDKRREVTLAQLRQNGNHDDFFYHKLDYLATIVYANATGGQTLRPVQRREVLRRAAWLSLESIIYAIARQEKNGAQADEEVQSLLAEIDSMPEYKGAHDGNGHMHRGRLIRILRRRIDFFEINSPITEADEFQIRYGCKVISRIVKCNPCGDGRLPPGREIKVDRGHTPPRIEKPHDRIPLPKFPRERSLTAQEEQVYSLMLVDSSLSGYMFSGIEDLFRHRDKDLLAGTRLIPSAYKRRLAYFAAPINRFSEMLRAYDESADSNTNQSMVERFLSWAKKQPIYARYTPAELADILDRRKRLAEVLTDYRAFLRRSSGTYKATAPEED